MPRARSTSCALCERPVHATTRHHLVPRQYGGELTAELCRACHSQVHALFENRTLARELGTLEALRAAPELVRYLRWVRRQPDRAIRVRKARRRRR